MLCQFCSHVKRITVLSLFKTAWKTYFKTKQLGLADIRHFYPSHKPEFLYKFKAILIFLSLCTHICQTWTSQLTIYNSLLLHLQERHIHVNLFQLEWHPAAFMMWSQTMCGKHSKGLKTTFISKSSVGSTRSKMRKAGKILTPQPTLQLHTYRTAQHAVLPP